MVKKLIVSFLFIFALGVGLKAEDITTTACPGVGCVTYPVDGQTKIAIQVTGTFVGTLTFSTSIDNSNFVTSQVVPVGALGTPVSTATAPGLWTLDLRGIKQVRVAFTAYTSGTAAVSSSSINR